MEHRILKGAQDSVRSAPSALDALSVRERQVLALIGDGLSMKEIADRMFRTVKTVEWYRACLGRKLKVRNRVQLARIAIDAGLVQGPAGTDRPDATVDRYRLAVAAAGACVFEFDPARGEFYLSAHGAALLGLDALEAPSHPGGWFDRVHPDDRRMVRAAAEAALAAGQRPSRAEFRVLDVQGRAVRVLARGSGQGGRLAGVVVRLGDAEALD